MRFIASRAPSTRSPRRWRKRFGEARKSALVWKPQNTIAVDDETAEKLMRLLESLDNHDDVQNVFANFEMTEEALAKLSG